MRFWEVGSIPKAISILSLQAEYRLALSASICVDFSGVDCTFKSWFSFFY